jgi:serine/threonine protein kinase
MGVVYKARDTRLGRIVAIKCLSTRVVADPARKQRFFRESQAASSLNHPNIVAVYELFNEGNSDYLVMEYVNGKTLEQIVSSKRLKIGELLDCAVQIADALAAAHASGIIHRDIKPSNIMIADDGRIKVLDFGLAKLLEQTSAAEESTRIEIEQTAEGTIIGSAPYMSPEQAEGRPVDARTDIFSFGAVMYEMCTGQRAFSGDSRVSTLAAVLTNDPIPIENLAPHTPKELQRIILRCLHKDPRRRFQSVLDLKLTLEELKADSDSGQLTVPRAHSAKNRTSWARKAMAAGVLALLAAGAWFWWRSEESGIRQPLVLEQLTFDSGLTTNPAIARDGKLIAYASDRAGEGSLDIWVQYRGGEPVRITRDPADEDEPSFSPDGTKIAYRSSGGIYIISSLGGEQPRQIANFGSHPQFSPDGNEILFETGGVASLSRVYRVNVAETGASPVQVAPELLNGLMPLWSPDGQHVLFIASGFRDNQVETGGWVIARNGGAPERVSEKESSGLPKEAVLTRLDAWLAGDRIIGELNIRGRLHLFQARLHRKPWRIDRIEQITFGTGMVERASAAAEGTMVVSNEETDLDLWSLPLDARRGIVNGEARRLTQDASRETFPSISADGSKMVYESELAGKLQIWFMDLNSGTKRPLTPPSKGLYRPAIHRKQRLFPVCLGPAT